MKALINVIWVDDKTNRILPEIKYTNFPYIGDPFTDSNGNTWEVKNISIDLLNGKCHIYLINK